MPGVPLFLIFSTFQAETVQIETTFVLPPLGEAVISEIELRLPHQIPDLIPKETKKDIPRTFLKDLNKRLFSLCQDKLPAESTSGSHNGKLLAIDSTGVRIYHPFFSIGTPSRS